MARYSTAQDFIAFFGSEELTQLLSDEQASMQPMLSAEVLLRWLAGDERCPAGGDYCFTEEQWQAAQTGADRYELVATQVCNHIDSKIGNRYRLPLPPSQLDTTPLRRCATMLVRCMLMDDDDNSSERSEGEKAAKPPKFDTCPYWDQWLNEVANGAADLGADIVPSPSLAAAEPSSRIQFGQARTRLGKAGCHGPACAGLGCGCRRCR